MPDWLSNQPVGETCFRCAPRSGAGLKTGGPNRGSRLFGVRGRFRRQGRARWCGFAALSGRDAGRRPALRDPSPSLRIARFRWLISTLWCGAGRW